MRPARSWRALERLAGHQLEHLAFEEENAEGVMRDWAPWGLPRPPADTQRRCDPGSRRRVGASLINADEAG